MTIGRDELAAQIAVALSSKSTREAVASWARSLSRSLDPEIEEARLLLAAADEPAVDGTGAYTVREHALRECLADLRREAPHPEPRGHAVEIRPWQARAGITGHLLEIATSPTTIGTRIGIEPTRVWLDGLGRCARLTLELRSGRQVCLERPAAAGAVTVVHAELGQGGAASVVEELLEVCGCSESDILWRNEDVQW